MAFMITAKCKNFRISNYAPGRDRHSKSSPEICLTYGKPDYNIFTLLGITELLRPTQSTS